LSFKLPGFHQPLIVRDEKGFTLIEVLIVIVLTTLIVAGVLVVMGTSSKILAVTNTQETAKDIAISDMEYVISQPYYNQANQTSYQLPTATQNYIATLNVTDVTWNAGAEEEIDITIALNGKTLFTLTDFRTPYAD
jgi:type II secretory pathway pseudopilin PulG